MSVHYKFKSALSFDTITFDGLHISVRDLKRAILQQKQIGKATDFDLQITNAQSNEVYDDDSVLIPKNSSLIVVRVPLTAQQKKNWEKNDTLPALNSKQALNSDAVDPLVSRLAKTVDLANVDASEGDKIQAAITQSTLDYDPSNYLRIKGSNQVGELPANYRCYKCLQPGHWIKDCKLNAQQENAVEIKKSTGIPRSFMVPVEGPEVPGAMMTPTGQFAVPSIEHEARREPIRKPIEPAALEKPKIPEDLLCGVCRDLLSDAVLIPCCGNSFCDECIRNVLLESEEHQCPDCKETGVSPDTLIPNRFLRNSVNNFKNSTGYISSRPVRQHQHSGQPRGGPSNVRPHHPLQGPSSSLIAIDVADELPKSSPPFTPASPDTKEPTITPDDVLLVNEDGERSAAPPMGKAIPTILQTDTHYPPHQIHPLHSHTTSRIPPNPNICPQGEDKPPHHYKDKSGGYGHKSRRSDRSGTPTIDERSSERYHHVPMNQGMNQQIHPPMNNSNVQPGNRGPIHNYRGNGNYMYNRGPHYGARGSRPPPVPYGGGGAYPPPGTGNPPPHLRGAPPYRGPRPRPPYRPHSPNKPPNSGAIPSGPIDDPLEVFQRMMAERDAKKDAKKRRARRSGSRSPFSRSPRSRSPIPRASAPRSRSRSRTRASTRTRSRSRSPVPVRRRRRSRSRSFSISRSSSRSPPPARARSRGSRSVSRDRRSRDFSPKRRPEFRPSPPPPRGLPTSPIRHYTRSYKEEQQYNPIHQSRNGRGRYPSKSVDHYYPMDYPRDNERFDRGGGRDRDRERGDRLERGGERFERDRGERPERERERERDKPEREPERGGREKERFERDRERVTDKERDRDRDREREKERDRDRPYSTFKRYDYEQGPRDYEHAPVRDPAREWEKTRDREIEIREKEKQQAEYYRKREQRGNPVETIETIRDCLAPPGVDEERNRVLVNLPIRSEIPEKSRSPEKEKKTKEKKKKKKEDSEKKKKKRKVKEKPDKKESLEEGEIAPDAPEEGEVPDDDPKKDDLYGDLGANVDQFVVETYNKALSEEKKIVPEKDIMLATVPELSKWEKDERERLDRSESDLLKPSEGKRLPDDKKRVTSEILERAMNVITKKAVKPQEKKSDRKAEGRDRDKGSRERERGERERSRDKERDRERDRREYKESERHRDQPKSVALPVKSDHERRRSSSRSRATSRPSSSGRISAKERLGAKVDDKPVVKRDVRLREVKMEKPTTKSVVSREPPATSSESSKSREERRVETKVVEPKVSSEVANPPETKKPSLEETTFIPDYEKSDQEHENKPEESQQSKKRSNSVEKGAEAKKIKAEEEKPSTEDSSASSDDSEIAHRKKKKRKHKKKKSKRKRHDTTSDSDSSSDSSLSESDRKKKKHKHKSHKKSKKRKKSRK